MIYHIKCLSIYVDPRLNKLTPVTNGSHAIKYMHYIAHVIHIRACIPSSPKPKTKYISEYRHTLQHVARSKHYTPLKHTTLIRYRIHRTSLHYTPWKHTALTHCRIHCTSIHYTPPLIHDTNPKTNKPNPNASDHILAATTNGTAMWEDNELCV